MEKAIKESKQTKNKLSILIAQDGLYFCITPSSKSKVIYFSEKRFSSPQTPEQLSEEVKSFFNQSAHKALLSSISAINVFYAHALFTLIPQQFFSKDNLSDYIKYNIQLLPTDELNYDQLKHTEANLAYIPYTNINNYLVEKFGEFTYQHAASSFIDLSYNTLNAELEEAQAFINVFDTHFYLCIYKNKTLLLCNSFDYHSPEDFVYYVLFTFEQLELDTNSIHLKLSGMIEKDSETFNLLYNYVRHVSFIDGKSSLKIEDPELQSKTPHKHQFLLNII